MLIMFFVIVLVHFSKNAVYPKRVYQYTYYIYTYYIPSPLTVHFRITRSMRYQPIFLTLYFTLHCAHVLNNVVLTTVIEMVEILDGRVGKRSVEQVRYIYYTWSL